MAEQHARYDDGVVGQVDGLKVPRYAGLTTFARLPRLEDVDDYDVAVVGVPFDCGVTYRPGARFGPSAIRQASRLLRPYNPALDVQPFRDAQVVDAGDVAANPFDIAQAIDETREGLRRPHHPRRTPGPQPRRRPHHRPPGAAGHAQRARAGGAGALRRPPRHLGHLLRRAVHARHAVPARVRGGADRQGPARRTSASAGSLYDRQDLLDDAGARLHHRALPRHRPDRRRRRRRARRRPGRRPPGLRLDRHRRPRPGVRTRDGHPRGRRHDQPRAARRAARDARAAGWWAPTSSRCHRPTTTPRSPPWPPPTSPTSWSRSWPRRRSSERPRGRRCPGPGDSARPRAFTFDVDAESAVLWGSPGTPTG